MINAGLRDGVNNGQIVTNDLGVVGRIFETGEKSSRILLLTDLNSRVPVVSAESRELSIVAGNNSPLLKMLYVPDGSKMKIGEEIYTSGDGEYFPQGLLIGYIYSINDKSIMVKPAVDWSRMEVVSIVNYSH